MVHTKKDDSLEDIAARLRAQAVTLWGEQRAGELEPSIQQTAQHLLEVSQESLDPDLEPGFYQ